MNYDYFAKQSSQISSISSSEGSLGIGFEACERMGAAQLSTRFGSFP